MRPDQVIRVLIIFFIMGLPAQATASPTIPQGVLDPWQNVNPMGDYRAGLAAVAANGHLYALGGLGFDGVEQLSVEHTKINSDGSLGTWVTLNPMTTSRNSFAAVAANNYMYAIGGDQSGAGGASTVERASILSDGTLGNWELISELTSARFGLAAVVADDYMYVIGGALDLGADNPVSSTVMNIVERARINTDGSLGSWETVNSMIEKRYHHSAVVANGNVYAIGGSAWIPPLSSVEFARINGDGTLSTWQPATSLLFPRQYFPAIGVGGHIFVIGGVTNTDVSDAHRLDDVHQAAINQDGSLGGWAITSSLITGRQLHAAALYNEFIYVLGGASDLYGQLNTVERARVLTDTTPPVNESLRINGGAINSPSTEVTLTVSASDTGTGVTGMSFSNSGNIWSDWQSYSPHSSWALGSGDGVKTVYSRFMDAAGNISSVISDTIELDTSVGTEYGLSINGGAIFTNDTEVVLIISARTSTSDIQISNDGGFSGAIWEPYASQKSWTITQYGDYVIPRVVYIRYRDALGNISSVFQDDIILDVNPPTGSVHITPNSQAVSIPASEKITTSGLQANNAAFAAYLPLLANNYCELDTGPANVTLQLYAKDDVSGVGFMMISNRPTFDCSQWQPYEASKLWYLANDASTVYVKYRDNAGNISAVIIGTTTTTP